MDQGVAEFADATHVGPVSEFITGPADTDGAGPVSESTAEAHVGSVLESVAGVHAGSGSEPIAAAHTGPVLESVAAAHVGPVLATHVGWLKRPPTDEERGSRPNQPGPTSAPNLRPSFTPCHQACCAERSFP